MNSNRWRIINLFSLSFYTQGYDYTPASLRASRQEQIKTLLEEYNLHPRLGLALSNYISEIFAQMSGSLNIFYSGVDKLRYRGGNVLSQLCKHPEQLSKVNIFLVEVETKISYLLKQEHLHYIKDDFDRLQSTLCSKGLEHFVLYQSSEDDQPDRTYFQSINTFISRTKDMPLSQIREELVCHGSPHRLIAYLEATGSYFELTTTQKYREANKLLTLNSPPQASTSASSSDAIRV